MTQSNVKFANGINDVVSSSRVSRAFTGALILGSTSPSLSNRSPASSTPSSANSSRSGTPPSVASHSVVEVERCNCCTIDDFWKVYDSFKLLDKRGSGLVRRCDFYEASTEHVTLEMRRTITRGDLHQRFRSNPAEMTLEELLQRCWPTATDADRSQMNHWAKLRDASKILLDSSFQGTRQDLKRIFDLLDVDQSETLSMSELLRARILTKGESQNLLEQWYRAFNSNKSGDGSANEGGKRERLALSFNEFCMMTQKHLCDKYAQKDDETTSWDVHCRSAFHSSKATTAMLSAAKEGRELPADKAGEKSTHKMSMKAAGAGIKAATAAFGFRQDNVGANGNGSLNRCVVMAC